jgi:hypothetical protein
MRSYRTLPKLVLPALLIAIALLGFSLVGCGGKTQATPTPTKTPTPPPVATVAPAVQAASQVWPTPTPTATRPDATVTPTQTTAPTPQEEKPGPTATEMPDPAEVDPIIEWTKSRAQTPAPTPVPISAQTPIPTPVPIAVPPPAPAGPTEINPLTGLPVAAYKLNRRPIAVKIPNFPWEARPQSGLSRADVVIEHEAEAYLTRFTAIFYGSDAATELGPVRSVRLVDAEIVSMYHASLVTSGGHPAVKLRVTSKSWAAGHSRVISPDEPFSDGGCTRRVPKAGRRYELTLYTDTSCLWNLSAQRGINQRPDFGGMWVFDESPPPGGRDATHLRIVYKPTWSIAEYRYDAATKTYRRFDVGQATTDAVTGRQIAPPNVVVLYANHVNSDIAADTHDPNNIWYSVIIQLWGEGTGKLLRDGRVYDIRWVRENPQQPNDRLVFLDGTGSKIALRPGATWIQLVRPDADMVID